MPFHIWKIEPFSIRCLFLINYSLNIYKFFKSAPWNTENSRFPVLSTMPMRTDAAPRNFLYPMHLQLIPYKYRHLSFWKRWCASFFCFHNHLFAGEHLSSIWMCIINIINRHQHQHYKIYSINLENKSKEIKK